MLLITERAEAQTDLQLRYWENFHKRKRWSVCWAILPRNNTKSLLWPGSPNQSYHHKPTDSQRKEINSKHPKQIERFMKLKSDISWLRKTNYEKMKNCLSYCYISILKIIFRNHYVTDFYPASIQFIFPIMIWTKEHKEDFLNVQMKTMSLLGGDTCGMR